MKNMVSLMLIITLSTLASANGIGSIDEECRNAGFSYGIAKYQCANTAPDEGDGSTLTVTWNQCISVDWTANPAVAGVLSKEGNPTYVWGGGTSGTITKNGEQDISHITFCGEYSEAPEYSSLAILLAALLTAPAIAYLIAKK
ncbi:MAG: hypothetical protein U9M95_01640 [Candidatus Altiarchaeota archaeon]|nr:hypothetical protein [Candidatus Altiarchaeota archaeon]